MFWKLSPFWPVNTLTYRRFFVVSAKVWLNLGFGTQKKCPFALNRGVPSIEVTNTKIMWTFFRDRSLRPLNRGDRCIKVFQRRGSIVVKKFLVAVVWKYPVGKSASFNMFFERARWSCSQSEHRIRIILLARGFSHIVRLDIGQSLFLLHFYEPRSLTRGRFGEAYVSRGWITFKQEPLG